MANLDHYIETLQRVITDKCLVITDGLLDKPHPLILWANHHFETLTGYAIEEIQGHSPRVLQGPKSDRATLDRLKKELLDGKTFEGGVINYRKDGTEFYKVWRIAPILDKNGKTIYYFAVHQESSPENYKITLKKIIELQVNILGKLDAMI
jgi:PAS domain S-box-containing protein